MLLGSRDAGAGAGARLSGKYNRRAAAMLCSCVPLTARISSQNGTCLCLLSIQILSLTDIVT